MKDGLLALTTALALCGCGKGDDPSARRQAPDGGGDAAAVRAAEEAQLKAFRNRDVNGVLAGYAPDATLMMGGQAPLSGEAIRASLTREVADPAFSIALDNKRTEVGAGGDFAYTRGDYHVTYSDPGTRKPVSEDGHYVTVFRRQPDGAWKAVEDIASPGPPPAAAAGE